MVTPLNLVDWYIEMLNQVNIIRAKADKAAVTHSNPTGTLGERCTRAGVKWWGIAENAAGGQRDVTSVVTAWKNSKGHYENLIVEQKYLGCKVDTAGQSAS
ncbi:hypothetical protein BX661DRAFT_171508 [Kickxella alabastrina]|uniref:uncharacterized protein n=1 Tax=Kickxella alabastrina TaxID=61397 RepID=UPI002220EF19|nr:uncharacterized protein BX661DRAFT_171508 [Kickxella alabastrina]KAI7826835.1 hypothetical protein BX661DRAFT_171508 [Kickxella alabastrina]